MGYEINFVEELAKREAEKLEPKGGLVNGLKNPAPAAVVPIKPGNNEKHAEPPEKSTSTGIVVKKPKGFQMRTIELNFEPANIPQRNWLIDNYLHCGHINLLISPGAVGKSIYTIVEAISVATGRDLLGLGKIQQGNVLIINNEDDDDELNRRIAAVMKHYYLEPKDLHGRLFVRSGYSDRVLIAQENEGEVSRSLQVASLIESIKGNDIKLVVIDPFVSTHNSNENDNSKIDQVVQEFKNIAGETKVAVRLVHHTRKMGSDPEAFAGDVEIARGASSLKDAARVCHTLTPMGKQTAKDNGIDFAESKRLIRIDDAKTNFSLSDGKAKWFRKDSVGIANGDCLGVPRPYELEIITDKTQDTPESSKAKTMHDIGLAVLNRMGREGGVVKGTELMPEYMLVAGKGKTIAGDHLKLLPEGSSQSQQVNLNGTFYRIYQVMVSKPTKHRNVHLMPDE